MQIQNNNPSTRIPGPSANLVRCAQILGFKLDNDGWFEDHRDISFCIHKIGKDITTAVIKSAWNIVVTRN